MGTVKFDLTAGDQKYKHISFSCQEDVYNILWQIDCVYLDAAKGNVEALALLSDLTSLMDKCNVSQVMKEYVDIMSGQKPLCTQDYDKEITAVIAKRLNQQTCEVQEQLSNDIKSVVNQNATDWLDHVNKKYKNQFFNFNKDFYTDNTINKYKSEADAWALDHSRKYSKRSLVYDGKDYPEILKEKIAYRDAIKSKADYYFKQKEKYYKHDNERYFFYGKKYKKLARQEIELNHEIVDLKKHYKIPVQQTNKKGKIHFGSIDHPNEDFEMILCKKEYEEDMEDYDGIISKVNVGKIKQIAEKVLTDKQYMMFSMYYIAGMTQAEIVGITGEGQYSISRELSRCINKIKEHI